MAAKYIKNNSGQLAEVEATTTSAGAGDAGKIIGLDSSGKIDTSMMPEHARHARQTQVTDAAHMVTYWTR